VLKYDERDDWSEPRPPVPRRPVPRTTSPARILIGIGICVAAAALFVVGLILLVRAASRNRDADPVDPNRPLTLNDAVRHVKEGDVFEQQKAAKFLAGAQVEPGRRQEVVAALKAAIDNRDRHVARNEMFDALAVWATADETPYLLGLLDDADGNVKVKAMYVLGKLKDPRAAEPLARRLTDLSHRRIVSQALKDMGPAAEAAVAEFLNHPDAGLRIEACDILKVVGTKASHPALVKLAWDDQAALAQAALEALPADQRPPIYGLDQIMHLSIHVPDVAAWPAIEKKLRALAEGEPVMLKHNRSGEQVGVRLAPVKADPNKFATRIDFGEIVAIHTSPRLIYVNKVALKSRDR
jgi:hypothetical protein